MQRLYKFETLLDTLTGEEGQEVSYMAGRVFAAHAHSFRDYQGLTFSLRANDGIHNFILFDKLFELSNGDRATVYFEETEKHTVYAVRGYQVVDEHLNVKKQWCEEGYAFLDEKERCGN